MFDEEIEKAILYYIIFENADYIIQEEDFVNDRNKKIAKAIIELRKTKKEVSLLSVKNNIKATNPSEVLNYISNIGNNIFGSNADELYSELIQLSKKRKLFNLAHKILQDIETENVDIYSQKLIKQINEINKEEEKDLTLSEQIIETMNQIENSYNQRNDYSLYTNITDLDRKICGLHNQELTIIGARPRCRKNNTCLTNSPKNCKR